MKLINLGLPKSGTSTLQKALSQSGMKSVHWAITSKDQDGQKILSYVGEDIYASYHAGNDPLASLSQYEAITQADVLLPGKNYWPQCDFALLDSIRGYHPDCAFLLLTRDPAQVADSMIRWTDLQKRFVKMGAPGLSRHDARSQDGLMQWINAHNNRIREKFSALPNFVEIDVANPKAPEILSDLVGHEIKWWGVANKNDRPRT